jgi:glycosyltransferase involved in cell wall biosynthesis
MEALAAGVPLVVSDLPVFREIFRDAASYATGPEDLARHLLAAPSTDRSARGRALAATYSWPTAAAAHLEFYARR